MPLNGPEKEVKWRNGKFLGARYSRYSPLLFSCQIWNQTSSFWEKKLVSGLVVWGGHGRPRQGGTTLCSASKVWKGKFKTKKKRVQLWRWEKKKIQIKITLCSFNAHWNARCYTCSNGIIHQKPLIIKSFILVIKILLETNFLSVPEKRKLKQVILY